VLAAPAQKKVAVQRLSSTVVAKRLRESDSNVEAEVPRARFKSPTFALGQDMLVVVPFVDSGCVWVVLRAMVILIILPETGVASFWFAKILRVTEAEAHLIQLEPVAGEANAYRANMRSVWAEPIRAVHVVDGSYDERTSFYSLRTSVADILKVVGMNQSR
jgi:hypothetical protein